MKSKITLILLLLFFMIGGSLFAQIQINTPLSYQPASLEQGGAPGTFKVDIVNNNTSALTGSTLSIVLPAGMEYVTGTVTAATQLNVSDLQSPTFTLTNIPVGNTLTVTFNARINCGYTVPTIKTRVEITKELKEHFKSKKVFGSPISEIKWPASHVISTQYNSLYKALFSLM